MNKKLPCVVCTDESEDKSYEVEIVTRGNCMLCGKKLGEDEGLFFCKKCEEKVESEDKG